MNSMIHKVLNFIDSSDMLCDAATVLVCVSGGADSMVLLHVMREVSKERGFLIAVAHFNHNLRGEESDRDERFVKNFCETEKIPFYLERGDVRGYANANKLGIEESARNMRYAFFEKTVSCIDNCLIATGHTADDNAETVLLNLTRGTGLKGLCGIPAKRGNIIRPILQVSRAEILKYAAEHGIPYVEDSTNECDDYSRNKIRLNVMPVLKEINPNFLKSVETAGALIREDENFLSETADCFIKEHCSVIAASEPQSPTALQRIAGQPRNDGCSVSVAASELLSLPPAISGRVVRKLYGGNLSYSHCANIMKLCSCKNPSAALVLPNAIIRREYSHVIFDKISASAASAFEPFPLTECEFFQISEIGLNISCKSVMFSDKMSEHLASFLFKSSEICGMIWCRPRMQGDSVRILGRNVSKSLKKLFIEHHIPKHKRNLIPVISDDAGVLAVYGVCRSNRAIAREGDVCTLVEFSPITAV